MRKPHPSPLQRRGIESQIINNMKSKVLSFGEDLGEAFDAKVSLHQPVTPSPLESNSP
jgi:hypothetical protein